MPRMGLLLPLFGIRRRRPPTMVPGRKGRRYLLATSRDEKDDSFSPPPNFRDPSDFSILDAVLLYDFRFYYIFPFFFSNIARIIIPRGNNIFIYFLYDIYATAMYASVNVGDCCFDSSHGLNSSIIPSRRLDLENIDTMCSSRDSDRTTRTAGRRSCRN